MSDDRRRRPPDAHAPTSDPLGGSTLPHAQTEPSDPDGTLDLPAQDQVSSTGELAPGGLIGRFIVRARLGEGGMGVVVAAYDADLGRPVAIKLVRGDVDHPAYRARLQREAQAMARLEHPNVVRVYEVGTDRGRLFVAMELVNGVTLSTWLRVQRRSWREVIAIFEQVGAGLAAVHRVGLVHRDFKPDNVLVDRDGRARVADFGLARLDPDATTDANPSPELAAQLTRTGMMMGTPGYMAPEQQFGGNVDARADQYSFCVALREALLGGRPKEPTDVHWGTVPRAVRNVVTRGLSYDAVERFGSMEELLAVLGRAGNRRRATIGAAIALLAISASATAAVIVSTRDRSPSAVANGPADAGLIVAQAADADPSLGRAGRDAGVVVVANTDAVTVEAPLDARVVVAQSPPDASVVVVTPPRDAGVARTVHARIDAGAVAVAIVPPTGLGSATPVPLPMTGIPAWSQRSGLPPAANPKDPSHAAVLRAAIRDLGYDAFDPKASAADVDALDEGVDQAIARVKFGMALRRSGHCDLALAQWQAAKALFKPDSALEWSARAALGTSLCELAAGKVNEAETNVHFAWIHGNQDEVRLVMALTRYENGEIDTSYAMFLAAQMVKSAEVHAAIKTWLAGTGLTLP